MKKILEYLFQYKILSRAQAKDALLHISKGEYSEYEITAFVTVFMMRSIAVSELQGFVDALLELAVPVDLGTHEVIDIVGTGGDGKNTFNISTLASFIVAGAGHKVAKQGNYGATSVSGSSNVLELMGYKFKSDQQLLRHELETCNICFMHAPFFHPALKQVAPMRKKLAIRTFFNLLGPLVNPCKPKFQVLGVYNMEAARLYNYFLQEKSDNYCVIFGMDGYDEISLTGDTKVCTAKGEFVYSAEELGKRIVEPEEIFGGDTTQEAADLFQKIISGNGSWSQNAVVLANAAMAMYATGLYDNYDLAYQKAVDSLESGKAFKTLQKLIALQA